MSRLSLKNNMGRGGDGDREKPTPPPDQGLECCKDVKKLIGILSKRLDDINAKADHAHGHLVALGGKTDTINGKLDLINAKFDIAIEMLAQILAAEPPAPPQAEIARIELGPLVQKP